MFDDPATGACPPDSEFSLWTAPGTRSERPDELLALVLEYLSDPVTEEAS